MLLGKFHLVCIFHNENMSCDRVVEGKHWNFLWRLDISEKELSKTIFCEIFAVSLEKLRIVRSTRTTLGIELDGIVKYIKRPANFAIDVLVPQRRIPVPRPKKLAKPKRRPRNKVIKVYGRNVRRPKVPRKADKFRIIDMIDEPYAIPTAFITPKVEMSKSIWIWNICISLGFQIDWLSALI